MANEFDGRSRMAAALLISSFYGMKVGSKYIASILYLEDNQWYLSGQDIYTYPEDKRPNNCRWNKIESDDLSAWYSDNNCVLYTFVDPLSNMMFFGHAITPNDDGFGCNELDALDLSRFVLNDDNGVPQRLTCGIIDIITRKMWEIDIPIPANLSEDKWERLRAIRSVIEKQVTIE